MNDNQIQDQNLKATLLVNLQYVKDLSFESPKSPASLIDKKEPKIGVSIDVNATSLGTNLFEVGLRIHIDGQLKNEKNEKSEEEKEEEQQISGTIFLLDLDYAGLFTIENVSDEEREMILLINCPTLLFPYARQIISDTMHNGGYPPIMLSPFDFMGLYQSRKDEIRRSTE